MAAKTEPKTADAEAGAAYAVLAIVEHNGVRYVPETETAAIPASEISEEQLAALRDAGAIAAA
jgi:microcystin degradation protein MlrC